LKSGLIEKRGWRQSPKYETVEKTKLVNGVNVTYQIEEEYFMVNGEKKTGKEYFEWISNQDPHRWQVYWQHIQDYRFGGKMTTEMAKCYSNRYPDLKAAFGMNTDALKNHWKNHGM
jgi:hypothetical protein